jgi:hypothetical protein
MPPLITISILFTIVCIITIARGSLITNDDISTSTRASNVEFSKNNELNESEKVVLVMLANGVKFFEEQQSIKDNKLSIYVRYLKEYLSSSGVNLSTVEAKEIINKIISMNAVYFLERETDLKKMSLDGRGMLINISEHIYELCGLRLIHNMQGDIVQISDTTGKYIYVNDNPMEQDSFHMKILIIILSTLAILLSICIIIAKKSQLFMKDGIYDGFKEKEFA